jgi:hypothetical protein
MYLADPREVRHVQLDQTERLPKHIRTHVGQVSEPKAALMKLIASVTKATCVQNNIV